QNVIERAVILSMSNRLELGDSLGAPGAAAVAPAASATAGSTSSARTLEQIQRGHIPTGLDSVGWRVSGERGAASILGLKRTTLEARMSKLGISRPQALAAN